MQSKATTVAEYIQSLPDDRRKAIEAVRKVILKNLDADYEEGMQYGMIGYYIPHRIFPAGYHCDPKQPLPFAGLASQKNHLSFYLMCLYGDTDQYKWFVEAWAATGRKLDMGKCCIRFKKVEDLALDVIAEALRRMPAKRYVEYYLQARADYATAKANGTAGKGVAKAAKKAVKKATKKTAKKAVAKVKGTPKPKAAKTPKRKASSR